MDVSEASAAVTGVNAEALTALPFEDRRDFAIAQHGFLAKREPGAVHAADGTVVWDNDGYSFLSGEAPDTEHPSLWRESQLNSMQGL
ncbi:MULTISPECIES: hypothetical protein [unclassified Arthrobacter]|uniref:hypothetical protein n=1 Tax=unclassified Arthrobacter TaxID=235627 RepID=UPI002E0714EE|nr:MULTISPECIES: hypothetical protein [unclassified Arthrobacter]MEC5190824.1 alkyl sulfatase BDS1-like metallo-beta-lactamase superfamily hydrolase [Arthrobacter sp. MP_M4]MEC5202158.1 alkyl sulfatase BDS1-like metallo-beta-lactamase superfamily hydrolase [Arthrobacter sp. MP_M7]